MIAPTNTAPFTIKITASLKLTEYITPGLKMYINGNAKTANNAENKIKLPTEPFFRNLEIRYLSK